jgi:hypothetical protein
MRDAAAAIGLTVSDAVDAGMDLELVNPAGGRTRVQVKARSSITAPGLRLQHTYGDPASSPTIVLVADRITAEARQLLNEGGRSWLDLRGHLHLVGPGLFVDADVPSMTDEREVRRVFGGSVAVEVAAHLLLNPDTPAAVRQIAEALGRAPSSVSTALSSLRDAAFIGARGRPIVPDLFWALAEHWRPHSVDLDSLPIPSSPGILESLRLGLHDPAEPGWALTDTVAAAAYGAPVAIRSDHPRDFYVPDAAALRRAVRVLGRADDRASRAATVRAAPVPMACTNRVDVPSPENEHWPVTRPLFVALDLARDPGRGREVLDGWTPVGWPRVW